MDEKIIKIIDNHITEDLSTLGIDADVVNLSGETFGIIGATNCVRFKSKEDMNLYRMLGKHKESEWLIFKYEENN